jgi:hypothetical protein
MNQKGRWRHLNTFYFNNSSGLPLRPSKSTIVRKFPDQIEFIGSNLLVSSNKTAFLLQNSLYDNKDISSNSFNGDNEIKIDFNLSILTQKLNLEQDVIDYNKELVDQGLAEDITKTKTGVFQTIQKISVSNTDSIIQKLNEIYHYDIIPMMDRHMHWLYYTNVNESIVDKFDRSDSFNLYLLEFFNYIRVRYIVNLFYLIPIVPYPKYKFLNITQLSNNLIEISLDCIYKDGVYTSRTDNGKEEGYGYDAFESVTKNKLTLSISPTLRGQLGLDGDIVLDKDTKTKFYLNTKRLYQILEFRDKYFGVVIDSEKTLNQRSLLGSIDKFQIINKDLKIVTTFSIKDKIGNTYLTNQILYNTIPEKSLIKKYTIDTNNIDLSYNNIIIGTQLFQDYSYSNFGNTFSIFQDKYAVIGTTEGKVIIQHLLDKNAAKAIINSGSKNYSKFGSVVRAGKYIYINAPELNKLLVLSAIPYYE